MTSPRRLLRILERFRERAAEMTRRGAWLFGVIVGALAWMILRHLEATSPYTARTESTVASLIQGFQAGVRE